MIDNSQFANAFVQLNVQNNEQRRDATVPKVIF